MCGPEGGTQGPNLTPKAFSNARTLNPLEGRGRCLTRTTCSGAATSLDSRWRHCQRRGLRPSFQHELQAAKWRKKMQSHSEVSAGVSCCLPRGD